MQEVQVRVSHLGDMVVLVADLDVPALPAGPAEQVLDVDAQTIHGIITVPATGQTTTAARRTQQI